MGVVTSSTRSPLLNQHIALARVDVEYATMTHGLEIGKLDGFQKRIVVEVVRFPFYDPEKRKPRS